MRQYQREKKSWIVCEIKINLNFAFGSFSLNLFFFLFFELLILKNKYCEYCYARAKCHQANVEIQNCAWGKLADVSKISEVKQ
jgi:hypothetical protein